MVLVVVIKDAPRSPIEIVILFRFERPQEGREPNAAEDQGDRDEKEERVHATLRNSPEMSADKFACDGVSRPVGVRRTRKPSRKALPITMMLDDDMARAAINGVASPSMAIGTARIL
jgi:hypothetical protein